MTTLTAAAAAAKPTTPTGAATEPSESRIDRDSHFNGLYETKQNLRIEGLAEGEIQCDGTVTVAEGARVKAKVTANAVTIAGELDGEVLCHGVFQIMPSGQVSASVSARRLIVQEGGLYNGDFRMITDDSRAPRPPAPASKGDKRAAAPEGSSLDALSTEDWWKKLTAETPEPDASQPDASEPKASDAEGK